MAQQPPYRHPYHEPEPPISGNTQAPPLGIPGLSLVGPPAGAHGHRFFATSVLPSTPSSNQTPSILPSSDQPTAASTPVGILSPFSHSHRTSDHSNASHDYGSIPKGQLLPILTNNNSNNRLSSSPTVIRTEGARDCSASKIAKDGGEGSSLHSKTDGETSSDDFELVSRPGDICSVSDSFDDETLSQQGEENAEESEDSKPRRTLRSGLRPRNKDVQYDEIVVAERIFQIDSDMDEPKLAVASLPSSDTEYSSIDQFDESKIVVLPVQFTPKPPRRPRGRPPKNRVPPNNNARTARSMAVDPIYEVPKELQGARLAMGEEAWWQYVATMEAYILDKITQDELDSRSKKLFHTFDEGVFKILRKRVHNMVRKRIEELGKLGGIQEVEDVEDVEEFEEVEGVEKATEE